MAQGSSKPRAMAKVFLVDDHPVVLEGLAQIIESHPLLTVCGSAPSPKPALAKMAKAKPDVLVADLSFPDGSGLELAKEVRVRFPGLAVLMLSMHEEGVYAMRALRAGALGYVMKDEAGDRICEAVLRVLGGEVYVSKRISQEILIKMVEGDGSPAGMTDRLSDRELQVFEMVGQGLGAGAIAEKLILSRKTVETYYANIKVKMNLADAAELRRRAIQWMQSRHLQ